MRLTNRSALLALGALLAATPARADLVYPVSYVGTGVTFTCDHYLLANCSVSGGGSIVTLFNNGGSLSFQVTPSSGSFVASNASSVSFPFATFASTLSGPFSTLPSGAGNEPLFLFFIPVNFTTVDGTASGGFSGAFYRDPGGTSGHIAFYGGAGPLPSSSLPPGSSVEYWQTSPPFYSFAAAANSSATLVGFASIAPEPSTIVLSASGLGLLGLFAMRRRRRPE